MSVYRTGNHWGVTIVREYDHLDVPGVDGVLPRSELVAVVTNGDAGLAERICALLNASDGALAQAAECTEETRSWDHFTPEQMDSYWIRCTLSVPHDEHHDEHTGLTWRTPETAPASTEHPSEPSVGGNGHPEAQGGLNGPMVARLRQCAADTSPNWDGKITIYPPEARELVALIDECPRHGAVI